MSDENRDQDTGQYTSAEPLYGKALIEHEAGYVPYKEEKAEPEELTVEQAAAELAQSRTPESEIKTYSPVSDLPENVTLTVEQAAKLSAEERAAEVAANEEAADEAFRKEIDELRGEEPEAKKAADTKATASHDALEGNGLDPDIEKALSNPKIQAALSQHHAEVETARHSYTQAVNVANQFARASFVENFPEIASLPVEHWEGALGAMAQREPERFNKALGTIQRVVQLQAAQEEQQQIKAHAEQRDLQAFAKTESARFSEMIKGEPKERVRAVESAIVESINEYGGDTAEFLELMKSTKLLNSAIAQRLLYDAGQYRLLKSAPAKAASKGLPPVQRPGVAGQVRSQSSSQLASLEKQLEGARGDRAVKLSAQIMSMKRARG